MDQIAAHLRSAHPRRGGDSRSRRHAEEAGIALPADTKISFAETPLRVDARKAKAPSKKKSPRKTESTGDGRRADKASGQAARSGSGNPPQTRRTQRGRRHRAALMPHWRAAAASINLRHSAELVQRGVQLVHRLARQRHAKTRNRRSPLRHWRGRSLGGRRRRPRTMIDAVARLDARHRRALQSAAPRRSATSSCRSPRSRPISEDSRPRRPPLLFEQLGRRLGGLELLILASRHAAAAARPPARPPARI